MKSRLFGWFPIKNITTNINNDIGKYGLPKAMNRLIKKCGGKLTTVNKSKELEEILKNKPVLLVANHPAEADFLAILAALPHRKNIKVVMNACFVNICKNLDEYIIPVHILNRLAEKKEGVGAEILKKISSFPQYTAEEEHRKNVESIRVAGRELKRGNLVIIFPAAGSVNEKWFNGVGHLVKNSEKEKDVYVIKAFIQGTSIWDYFRIVPLISRLLPQMKVTFSEAVDLGYYWSEDPKQTTVNLEADYKNWSQEIVNKRPILFTNRSLAVLRSVLFWLLMRNN